MSQTKSKKFKLLFYGYMLDRWWEITLFLGLILLIYVGFVWGMEWYYINPIENPFIAARLDTVSGTILIAIGISVVGFAIFLAIARNGAYVQPMSDHFKIVTPFYRINISYKRIHSTRTAEFGSLFPLGTLNNYKRELIEPFSRRTAVIVQLISYPVPERTLKLFLSPFFFADKTPHFVLLLDDWMSFNAALDSYRTTAKMSNVPAVFKTANAPQVSAKPQAPKPRSSMLAGLPKDNQKK
jgi:hypothetical protein